MVKLLLSIGLVALVACASPLGDGTGGGGTGQEFPVLTLPAGLSQHVSVTPESPFGGDDIEVRSMIRNDSTVALNVNYRPCQLVWGGNLRLSLVSHAVCGLESATVSLAPGDSVVTNDIWRVMSGPGNYVLNVGHLYSPAYGHPVPMIVQ